MINSKFKIGDKVRVKHFDITPSDWNNNMVIFMGDEVTIMEIEHINDEIEYKIKEDGNRYYWYDRDLEEDIVMNFFLTDKDVLL